MTSEGPGEAPQGSLRPTSGGLLVALVCVGMIGGWGYHRVADHLDRAATLVTWTQVLVLVFFAAALGVTAWATWRQVQRQTQWLEPHRAVNRLVLAKASALVGALVLGGYAGYALSWVGGRDELADERLVRSGVAALAGLAILAAALLLERACRVREDDPEH